jgi:hypothetical protein
MHNSINSTKLIHMLSYHYDHVDGPSCPNYLSLASFHSQIVVKSDEVVHSAALPRLLYEGFITTLRRRQCIIHWYWYCSGWSIMKTATVDRERGRRGRMPCSIDPVIGWRLVMGDGRSRRGGSARTHRCWGARGGNGAQFKKKVGLKTWAQPHFRHLPG